jgi:hypothetical protein
MKDHTMNMTQLGVAFALFSKFMVSSIIYPFQTLNRRIQYDTAKSIKDGGILKHALNIYSKEGHQAFFKGYSLLAVLIFISGATQIINKTSKSMMEDEN